MTREQAQREATKRWGKTAHIRAHEHISSPERRAKADESFQAAKAELEQAEKDLQAFFANNAEYQALALRKRQARERVDSVKWDRCYYKFAVGEMPGIGFHVLGQGDTWAECFAWVDERAAKRNNTTS